LRYRRVFLETAAVVIAGALGEVFAHVEKLEEAADGIEVLVGQSDATILKGNIVSQ